MWSATPRSTARTSRSDFRKPTPPGWWRGESEDNMLKVFYQHLGMWCCEIMYPAELKLFKLTKPDYTRIRHVERIR